MTRKKTISFLFPCRSVNPVGGFKVVFEYANRFAADGFNVNIIYASTTSFSSISFRKKLRSIFRLIYWGIAGYSGKKWYKLDNRVREYLVLDFWQWLLPKSDYYVATAIQTAYRLHNLDIPSIRKYYLIQDFESWGDIDEKTVMMSYRFGMINIVISDWLAQKVKQAGAHCAVIKNGFDFSYFKLQIPIKERNPLSIAMLYHKSPRKGCIYGIEALEMVRRRYRELRVSFFGVPPRPTNLPAWIDYYQKPDKQTHNRIYNEASIYLAPSLQEGWGLTVGEAMICGAAVVCTDADGFLEMVKNNENGIVCPCANATALANSIINLIENNEFRERLARKGNEDIQKYTWEESYTRFKRILTCDK